MAASARYSRFSGIYETACVVLDIGTRFTRCGFSGESEPRIVIPTPAPPERKPLGGPAPLGLVQTRTVAAWAKYFSSFFDSIFFKHLQVNPGARRLVICEDFFWTSKYKFALYNALLRLGVPAVAMLPGALQPLATLPQHRRSAVLVDVGFSETRVVIVFDGVLVPRTLRTGPIAMQAVLHELRRLLPKCGFLSQGRPLGQHARSSVIQSITDGTLEDILVKYGTVAPMRDTEEKKKTADEDKRPARASESRQSHSAVPPRPTLSPKPSGSHTAPARVASPGFSSDDDESDTTDESSDSGVGEGLLSHAGYPLYIRIGRNRRLTMIWITIHPETRAKAAEILFQDARVPGRGVSVPELVAQALGECPPAVRAAAVGSCVVFGGGAMLTGFKSRLLDELTLQCERTPGLQGLSGRFRVVNQSFSDAIQAWVGASAYCAAVPMPASRVSVPARLSAGAERFLSSTQGGTKQLKPLIEFVTKPFSKLEQVPDCPDRALLTEHCRSKVTINIDKSEADTATKMISLTGGGGDLKRAPAVTRS